MNNWILEIQIKEQGAEHTMIVDRLSDKTRLKFIRDNNNNKLAKIAIDIGESSYMVINKTSILKYNFERIE